MSRRDQKLQKIAAKIIINTPRLLIIGGPTASGKTQLAEQAADFFDCPIISFDSRQLFRRMNIGTAKPTADSLQKYKYYGIDMANPGEDMDVADFARMVIELIQGPLSKEKYIILVGGTGLYLKTILYGMDARPPANPELRETLNSLYKSQGIAALQKKLPSQILNALNESDRMNPLRLIRQLEILNDLDINDAEPIIKGVSNYCDTHITWLLPDRNTLYLRIEERVNDMMNQGLWEEAVALKEETHHQIWNTVGYKEIRDAQFDPGRKGEVTAKICQNTRRYAKRQYTWFRHQPFDLMMDSPSFESWLEEVKKKFK